MTMMKPLARGLLALICAGSFTAHADAGLLYEYTFSGTLFDVEWFGEPFAPFDDIQVGDPWEAVYLVNAEDADPGSLGFYWIEQATVTLPGITLSTNAGHVSIEPVFSNDISFVAEDMPFGGNMVTRFAGDVMSDELPDVATLEGLSMGFGFGAGELGGDGILVDGTIDFISLTIIPAPPTAICFAGVLLLNKRRRSRLAGPSH